MNECLGALNLEENECKGENRDNQDVTDLQDFANILRSELDGAHYLNDGRQAQLLGRINELSVQFNLLQAASGMWAITYLRLFLTFS